MTEIITGTEAPEEYPGLDQKLDAILSGTALEEGGESEEDDDEELELEGDEARATSTEEESDEPEGEPEGEEEGGEEREEPGKPGSPGRSTRSEDAETAIRAAQTAGLPASWLASATDEELISWHTSKLRGERDVRLALNENAELRRQLEELQAAKGPELAKAVPAGPADQGLPEEIRAELGDDGAKALHQWIASREEKLQARLAQIEEGAAGLVLERVWDRLEKEGAFGEEVPADAFERVVSRATKLAAADGEWSSLSGEPKAKALLKAAARLELDIAPRGTSKKKPAESAARRNGTPLRAQQRKGAPRQESEEEALDRMVQDAMDGKTAAQIRARSPVRG